tara:strand:- start:402 stop:587 length:186 start_codon:yes stop_codon:yes gene_type:complete
MKISIWDLIEFSLQQKGVFVKIKYTLFGFLFFAKIRKELLVKNSDREIGNSNFSDDVYPLF